MLQRFSVTNGHSVVSATIPPCPKRDIVFHAVDTYAFLLPERNHEYGAKAFAALIREHSDHPRVQVIADAVENADAYVDAGAQS